MNARSFFAGCLCIMFAIGPAFAQKKPKPADFGIKSKKALKYYEEGLMQAQYRDRQKAIAFFEAALELEPDFAHAHYELGINAAVKKQYDIALPHLEETLRIMPDEFSNLPYFLGISYFYTEDYAPAAQFLGQYLESSRPNRQFAKVSNRLLPHAQYAKIAIKDSVDFRPENLGENINTQYQEYLPVLTADDGYLLFTSRRPESTGGYNRMGGGYTEDFFYSNRDGNSWTLAENLGGPINTPENEGSATLTQDGQIIIFTACNQPDGFGNCDLYWAKKEGDRWAEPVNMGAEVNTDSWESQPCLSPDGRYLYFSSSRPGGLGGRDIWYCERQENGWSTAVNLGEPINSPGNEDSPFLHADGKTMYFSSDHHLGFGGQDLFKADRVNNGWAPPVNLGYPINSSAIEDNIFVSANGRVAFINSVREGGFGMSDLYTFEMPESAQPRMATFLRGFVKDSISRKPLTAEILIVDVETRDTVRKALSDVSGKFLMSLPLDHEYAAFVESAGYLFYSRNFFLKDLDDEIYFDLNIDLVPLRKDMHVVLENLFFDTGKFSIQARSKAELEYVAKFLKDNPGIIIEIEGHTDDVGSDADNLRLSQQRAEEVQKALENLGVATGRVSAKGYGESKPVADNETEEGRAQNRRTEFRIVEIRTR
ncbi:OmpA family protein [Pontibacter sp. G13]|uniref:OmpA family protein n=1 Tax=Pontibacter sp. G13 TaxID=3074898 RepID=UPI00288B6578|nr:OmpA family protein [Pontibacter sp. G13]WNJ16099.1 OmpA family protein [Pontibacter sp. G13]